MGDEGRDRNRRYAEGSHGSTEPDEFLLWAWREHVQPHFAAPGSALDVAGGLGRHALWVAAQGWQVTLVDSSPVALAKAQAAAEQRGLSLNLAQANLKQYDFGRERFDLILVFFYLERALFPSLEQALRPGGILLYKTYTRRQLELERGPRNPAYLLEPGELERSFPRLKVLEGRETVTDRAVAEFVGQRTA